jgi:hypothetical protein
VVAVGVIGGVTVPRAGARVGELAVTTLLMSSLVILFTSILTSDRPDTVTASVTAHSCWHQRSCIFWLVEVYKPIESKVRNVYDNQLRTIGEPDDAGKAARDAHDQLLGKEFVTLARMEVQGLRDPRKLHIR